MWSSYVKRKLIEEGDRDAEFSFGQAYWPLLVPTSRKRPDFSHGLVSSAENDGFSLLHFFKVTRQMRFGFMDIKFNHGFRLN